MKKAFIITILMVLAVTIANAQTTLKKVYDETIDPSSTYQLVNALIKANKEFDLSSFLAPTTPWARTTESTSAMISS